MGGRRGQSERAARSASRSAISACPAYDTNAAAFFASLAGRMPRTCAAACRSRHDDSRGWACRAMREDRGRFAALRDARVLIYWPHGLGDWVHFGDVATAAGAVQCVCDHAFRRRLRERDGRKRAGSSRSSAACVLRSDGAALGAPHLGLTLAAVRRTRGVRSSFPPRSTYAVTASRRRRALDRLSRNGRADGISVSHQSAQPASTARAVRSGSPRSICPRRLRNVDRLSARRPATHGRSTNGWREFAPPGARLVRDLADAA